METPPFGREDFMHAIARSRPRRTTAADGHVIDGGAAQVLELPY
ncbi:hypothetical protein ACOI9Y_23860 [Mesorhizobium japonicum]|nr:hypothetical protein [Mesorhizobium loti]